MEKDSILYVLSKSKEFLEQKQIPNPRLDSELLLSDLLNFERIKLYSNFDRKLTETEKDEYRIRLKKRAEFIPVSYIINKKNFYKSSFYVDENVLIPRPETEELVEYVLQFIPKEEDFKILDLCTGSGCIGISIKLERLNSEIFFSDISEKAIEVAKKNFIKLLPENNFNFFESDLFDKIHEKFNLIVSNPPYILENQKEYIMKEVIDYEPHLALFIDDVNDFYSRFFKGAKEALLENGILLFETSPELIEILIEIAKKEKFSEFEIKKDLSNKNRFLKCS